MLSQYHALQPHHCHILVGIWKFEKNLCMALSLTSTLPGSIWLAYTPLRRSKYFQLITAAYCFPIPIQTHYMLRIRAACPQRPSAAHRTPTAAAGCCTTPHMAHTTTHTMWHTPQHTPCHTWHIQHHTPRHTTPHAAPGSHSNKSLVSRGIACRPLTFVWFCFCWECCQPTKRTPAEINT